MMSPDMVSSIINTSSLSENDISKNIIMPCLQAYSMRNGLILRNAKFVGGTAEAGNDIEYYELFGPDKLRFYTGIQVKKGNISVGDAATLYIQGDRALNKDIPDTSDGNSYRINRWIVLATGTISPDAKKEICSKLKNYGKPINFWEGDFLATLICEHNYNSFIQVLGIDPNLASSNNHNSFFWDPDNPFLIAEDFNSSSFGRFDIKGAPVEVSNYIYLTINHLIKRIPFLLHA